MYVWFTESSDRLEGNSELFFTVKPPHAPQPTVLGLLTRCVYPAVSITMDIRV